MEEEKLKGETALFSDERSNAVVRIYENERPLHGLAGELDWKFHGRISDFFKNGFITGKKGEHTYLPLKKLDRSYHLLIVGCGQNAHPGERLPLSKEEMKDIFNAAKNLKMNRLVVSKSDFGLDEDKKIGENSQGIQLCLVQ